MSLNQQLFKKLIADHDNITANLSIMIAETARDYYVEQFDTQSWEGKNWAPLSPATIKDKESKGFGNQAMLVRTSTLRNSIVNCIKKTGTNAAGRNEVVLSIDNEYAEYLKNGTDKMRARQFFVKSYTLVDRIERLIIRELGKI